MDIPDETSQITLTGLRVHGYHGVFAFERSEGQEFIIDVTLHLDVRAAAASDSVNDTVHYGELADALVEVVAGEPVKLLETLAERLAEICLNHDIVSACKVTVHKPQAPIAHVFTDVSVTVVRKQGGNQ